jgi:hypothetical protein
MGNLQTKTEYETAAEGYNNASSQIDQYNFLYDQLEKLPYYERKMLEIKDKIYYLSVSIHDQEKVIKRLTDELAPFENRPEKTENTLNLIKYKTEKLDSLKKLLEESIDKKNTAEADLKKVEAEKALQQKGGGRRKIKYLKNKSKNVKKLRNHYNNSKKNKK